MSLSEVLNILNLGGALVFAYVVVRMIQRAYESLVLIKRVSK
nr:MAG TPA: hypothetical protein [Caudoviricetes sp.]